MMISGYFVDIFCGLHHVNFQGHKQIWEGPSIKVHCICFWFGGPLGPQVKLHKVPIGYWGPRALSPGSYGCFNSKIWIPVLVRTHLCIEMILGASRSVTWVDSQKCWVLNVGYGCLQGSLLWPACLPALGGPGCGRQGRQAWQVLGRQAWQAGLALSSLIAWRAQRLPLTHQPDCCHPGCHGNHNTITAEHPAFSEAVRQTWWDETHPWTTEESQRRL